MDMSTTTTPCSCGGRLGRSFVTTKSKAGVAKGLTLRRRWCYRCERLKTTYEDMHGEFTVLVRSQKTLACAIKQRNEQHAQVQ